MPEKKNSNLSSLSKEDELIKLNDVRKALYRKIKEHPGGITGVWRTLSEQFRKKDDPDPSGIKGIDKTRISLDSFRKQVNRLNNLDSINPSHERMTLSIRNSSLLLLNIFKILGISSIKDLLGISFPKDDIDTLNRETNINTKEILDKLDIMNGVLSMHNNRTTRFPVSKVCHDFEDIVNRLYEAVFDKPDNNKDENNEFNHILKYIYNNSEESRLAVISNRILKNYQEYFSQDILLHEYLENILSTNFSEYNQKTFFLLTPLYILYFFICTNKKFLSVIINNEKLYNKGNIRKPFDGNNLINKKLINHNITSDEEYIPITEYIYNIICIIYKSLKNILLKIKNKGFNTLKEKYDEFVSILEDIIFLYYDLYNNKTIESQDWIEQISKNVNNLNDLYNRMSIGRTILLIPSESDIALFNNIRDRLQKIDDEFNRNII